MTQVVIENPILNSRFAEPTRHFRFSDDGITNEIVEERRTSSYFVPIAQPRKKGAQLSFDTGWTKDRIEEKKLAGTLAGPMPDSSREPATGADGGHGSHPPGLVRLSRRSGLAY